MNHLESMEFGGDFLMRSISYPQYRIVQSDTAKELTDELNAILKELKDYGPEVTFEGLTARVAYTLREDAIPESLADEYRVKGVNLYCEDCPYFERIKKRDGTPDLRKKIGLCPFASGGTTFKDCSACETLFKMINSGEVKLCTD